MFTISPASEPSVGFAESPRDTKFWGYGFAEGYVAPSALWRFTKNAKLECSRYGFSVFFFLPSSDFAHSVKIDGTYYVLDSGYNNERVSKILWFAEYVPLTMMQISASISMAITT